MRAGLVRGTGERRRRGRASWRTLVVSLLGAFVVLAFYRPPDEVERTPFAEAVVPPVRAAMGAFGRSGEVKMRFALPREAMDVPLEVRGDPRALGYTWVRLDDSVAVDSVRSLSGQSLVAPLEPGFYQLAVEREGERRVVPDITVAVLVPFEEKTGPVLDGYRIGTFRAEKSTRERERPEGFVKVDPASADVPITRSLRVGDFLTRDGQQVWPRYAAIDPRVVDKLELVLDAVRELRGDTVGARVHVNVHSAFRTPSYNQKNRFARDSRHMHGDAIDVAIDADGDGRFTRADVPLVSKAVELIERRHPDLVGGMGAYTSRKYNEAFVHIDARGSRARWRG